MIIVPVDTPGRRRRARHPDDGPPDVRRCGSTAATPRSSTATCGCRRRTSSATRATGSGSPSSGSAPAGSTTRCAGSASRGRAFDMLCERAVSRYTHGSVLADKQMIQDWWPTRAAEMQAARLLTLHAAWTMDQVGASNARVEIAMIKYWGARVLLRRDRPGHPGARLARLLRRPAAGARCTGPRAPPASTTAPTRCTRRPSPAGSCAATRRGEVPTEHVPTRAEAARRKFAAYLDVATADL